MDFVAQLGIIACGTRLKRLSEMLYEEGQRVYTAAGVKFEPKWFSLFILVSEKPGISVTEAANALGFSHVAVSKLAKELVQEELFTILPSQADRRRSDLKLSERGEELLTQLEPLWSVIETACQQISAQTSCGIMRFIEELETAIEHKALSQQAIARLQSLPDEKVEIIDYAPRYRHYFERLNQEWITRYFTLEPVDQELISDPERYILQKGGDVLFARLNGRIIGTCGLKKKDEHTFELVKMAVSETVQGRGIGRTLLEASIERARTLGADTLFLWTSSRLEPALALYHKFGFQHVDPPEPSIYDRGDVYMELSLLAYQKATAEFK